MPLHKPQPQPEPEARPDPLDATRDRVGDCGGFFLSPLGSPVAKALWFIESRLATDISLDDVAEVAGVSRYHLARAFEFATGQPLVRYIRGRRLAVRIERYLDRIELVEPVSKSRG